MKCTIDKLDRRFNGFGKYSHKIEFYGYDKKEARKQMHELRVWLWENYGPGAELNIAPRLGLKWAWDTENGNCRLYINEDILTFYRLKF